MRAIQVGFVMLLLLIISLQVEALLGQDRPIEVGVEMPGFVIRQGMFHGKIQSIFKDDFTEELNLISLGVYNQNGTLFEKDISRRLIGVGKEWEEY